MIHVCYGLYDKTGHYSKFTGTSIVSMFENTKEDVTVHILHDNTLSQENRDKFVYIAGKYGQTVKFYNVDILCPEKIQFLSEKLGSVFESRFSIGTFYRLMIDKKFFKDDAIQKIIYLDSDTVVNLDIADLWIFKMNRYPIAAVPELFASQRYMITEKFLINTGKVTVSDYFCAGVIVINLEMLEDDFFHKGVQWLADNPACECFDQDILNNFFATTYRKLPAEFNSFVEIEKRVSDGTITEKIYHYAGSVALGFDLQNPYDHLFFKYFVKTPWFDINFIESFYKITQRVFIECKDLLISVMSILADRERAFFVSEKNLATTKDVFSIRDHEEIVLANGDNPVDNLIEQMKKSKGKKLYIIVAKYSLVVDKLIAAGFEENQDFIDATLLLSDKHGHGLPTYPILKNM